jgi:structural maintenance of chromosome 4
LLDDSINLPLDKTQGFTRQIEEKQRELQPWSAKIRQKEGEVNIAKNEQDSLKRKVEEARNAEAESKATLSALRTEQQAKVRAN